jgi:GNAT superfamily N-acetyltransferase
VNEGLLIREFQSSDAIPPITQLLHSAYAPLARMGFRYLATHQDDAMTLRRLESGFSFLAELDGAIIATVTLRAPMTRSACAWYREPGVWSFGQFAVRPDLQGQGFGRRLVQWVEDHARARGAAELALDTAEGASHLRQWYERLGFRFIEHVSWEETNYRSVILSKRLAGQGLTPSTGK